jgi:hypothetical protein
MIENEPEPLCKSQILKELRKHSLDLWLNVIQVIGMIG